MTQIFLDGETEDGHKLQSSEGFHRTVGGSIPSIRMGYIPATSIGKFLSCFNFEFMDVASSFHERE